MPLIEGYDISYLPSAALLQRKQKHGLLWPWNHELAAFGNPVVKADVADGLPGGNSAQLQSLPHSEEEIKSIAGFVSGHLQLFLQTNDLKKIFLSETSGQSLLLHVSTHAFADGNTPESSRLLFSAEGNDDAQPSYVYLREIYEMNLSRVQLATISAFSSTAARCAIRASPT